MKLIKSTIALAVGLVTSSAFANDTITIEDIPKIQSVGQTAVDPEGELVAFTRSVPRELYIDANGSNYSELYVVDDKGVERPFITGKVSVRSIQWSADGDFIYFLTKKKTDKFTSLYRIAANGGESQKVLSLNGTSISSYKLNPNGNKV